MPISINSADIFEIVDSIAALISTFLEKFTLIKNTKQKPNSLGLVAIFYFY